MVINPIDSLYEENGSVGKAISLGFYLPNSILFGLPEREDTLMLKNTGTDPYQLFASDVFAHTPNNQRPLYGSVPYITSLGTTQSSSVTWVNSAHTWVSISDMDSGKYVNFISESGDLEFFVFAAVASNTTNHVKTI